MTRPVIGWEKETPIPDHTFNDFLSVRAGRLYLDDLELTHLFDGDGIARKTGRALKSPLELVYLPRIRQKINALNDVFRATIREIGYEGKFLYAYPSKANVAEEVIRTILRTGVHYEISSVVDTNIVRLAIAQGNISRDQMVICNGFKPAGLVYSQEIINLQKEHGNVIPIFEDPGEIEAFVASGVNFDVGVRQKSYGHHASVAEMDVANSRFGMNIADLWKAADLIDAAPNLRLKVYHAMVGSQISDAADFALRLKPAVELYAQLRKRYTDLSVFDFGGGVPAPLTLDFSFNDADFARRLLLALKDSCDQYQVPVPDVMGEMGRYTVAEHGAHFFKVVLVKENASAYPWYVINGSIMSSLPDSWALGDQFVVLPLNHLDKPFRRVQLGGITCDSDDIYPPKGSSSPLYLPVETNDLYIGFFNVGAYQEMLGGVGGSKHCVIPESDELIVDRNAQGEYQFQLLPGQNVERVLSNLGYKSGG